MKQQEIERWALRVIDSAKAGAATEDSIVELKSQWPTDHYKAARRIAALANAAHGHPVLFMIGVNEEGKILGASYDERAEWLSQMRSHFNELAPNCQDLNVPTVDGVVVALVFDTTRAPFVIKNPKFGASTGGPVALEVPWRDGTLVRSAYRSDLLRILVDTTNYRALLAELEWNGEACSRQGSLQQQKLRSTVFDTLILSGELLDLLPDIRDSVRNAYFAVSNAESFLRSVEYSPDRIERGNILTRLNAAKSEAKPLIEAAIHDLRTMLSIA